MRSLITAEFFTNTIRSILLIAFAKYLFDYTGQLWAIALVFAVDSLVSFVIPLCIGHLVDKLGSGRILRISSVCLFTVLLGGLVYSHLTGVDSMLVLATAILFNVVTPIVRMSVFTITPEVAKKTHLTSANSQLQVAVQAGQLFGLLVVALIMKYSGFKEVLIVAVFASAIALLFYYFASKDVGISHSAHETIKFSSAIAAISNKPVVLLLVAASLDIALISVFNLFLTPWVFMYYDGKPEFLSIIDGIYAVGAIVAGIVGIKIFSSRALSPWIGVASQLFAITTFFLFSIDASTILRFISIFLFGISCTLSVIYFNAFIQKHAPVRIKGRVVGIRRVFASLYITGSSFFISYAYSVGYGFAISFSIFICLANMLFLCYWIACAGHQKSISKLSTIYVT